MRGGRLIARAALAAVVLASGAAAAQTAKVMGDWLVQLDRDRFSGATNIIAVRIGSDGILLARCLGNRPSFVVKSPGSFAGETDLTKILFRADQHPTISTLGEVLDDETMEIAVHHGMFRQASRAKEVAFRFETKRARFDHVFKMGRAERAFETIGRECGLD